MKKLIFFILYLLISFAIAGIDDCKVTGKVGDKEVTLDLSPLKGSIYQVQQSFYVYSIGVCENAVLCNDEKYLGSRLWEELNWCEGLGTVENGELVAADPSDLSKGVVMKSNEFYYSMEVRFTCDPNNVGSPQWEGGDDSQPIFSWATKYACTESSDDPGDDPTKPKPKRIIPGLGVGGLIMILAIVGLIAYFVAGILIKKYKYMAPTFREQIPNGTFWKTLPFLVWDGVTFAFDGIKFVFGKIFKKGEYQTI